MRLAAALTGALLLAMGVSLMAGHYWIGPAHWFSGDLQSLIFLELRLPRLCVGVLVGVALGVSGAAMQGYLRNPLADPGLFGVSACAALGAVISLYFGLGATSGLLPLFALGGAMAGAALLVALAALARRKRRRTPAAMHSARA